MLEVLYSAALRVSELVAIDWEDIDLAKREVGVLGKGKKERQCPLGGYALEALIEYSRHYENHWEKRPEGPAPAFLSMWKPADYSTNDSQMVQACRREKNSPAWIPAQRGHSHARRWRRYQSDSKTVGTFVADHNGNLYARGD